MQTLSGTPSPNVNNTPKTLQRPTQERPTQGYAKAAKQRDRQIEKLDAEIGRLSHTINVANYELMVVLREFDERAGWAKWGFTDSLSWLKWRCDLSTGAARDKLRMAHALKELPLISNAFSSGKLSYTKVRAITRIANPANESELIDMATNITARHVEEHCKQRSNTQKSSTDSANRAQNSRLFRAWHDRGRGTVHFSIEMPAEEAELIEQAVGKAAVQLSSDTGSAGSFPEETLSWGAQQVDGLVSVCRSFLDGYSVNSDKQSNQKSSTSTADQYQVVVHIDESALAGSETGASQLPLEAVRRLCCDGSIIPLVETESGEPLNVGRKVRTVTTAIRRALWARDKGCGFPGCSHTRFVDAHHIRHWANGGETSLENMVLLCSSHHKLVHEGGYSVKRDHSGEIFFRRPDGKAVPHCGYRLEDRISGDEGGELNEADAMAVSNGSINQIREGLTACYSGKNSQEFFNTVESRISEPMVNYCLANLLVQTVPKGQMVVL